MALSDTAKQVDGHCPMGRGQRGRGSLGLPWDMICPRSLAGVWGTPSMGLPHPGGVEGALSVVDSPEIPW